MSQGEMTYHVDIVMCIDLTGSMQPCIETVKENALTFWPQLKKRLESASKHVDKVRVKVLGFRDFEADGDQALVESKFFEVSDDVLGEDKEFEDFVKGLYADGGGDEPENALEALALALKSDWTKEGDKRRHIVVMFTDASAHKLEDADTSNPYYPADMPSTFDELGELWDEHADLQKSSSKGMQKASKRMIIFAPEAYPWPQLNAEWEQVVYKPSAATDMGLADAATNDTIFASLVNSI